ncbi:uncharacterized mitochondrial protein AtMg00810-like [Gossypium hirsutum]|uniref:Uncharacterized mitochondrial protein AtMg00810-like n=1 Tax=Gossypium hirsutum TaxID=3635 RepID=A0A1U8NW07_GOSHI|nr:uncharacterized mitochondrial protein AtMg00810-like [Gossypium hirsutum]
MDDIILIEDDFEEIMNLKKLLAIEVEINDLGTLKYFLGIEMARSKEGIFVSQTEYILDLLIEIGLLGCKPIDTSIDLTKRLNRSEGNNLVDKGRYQRLVGKLIYLSHTRLDIIYSVSVSELFYSDVKTIESGDCSKFTLQ